MSALPEKRWTVEEYLAFERASEERHEFINGQIYLMSGASRKHNLIVFNLALALGNQLRGKGCETYLNEMRVKIPSTNNYTYPDVTIVCGEDAELEDDEFDTLLNPILIVEVLSPSTENYDRGKKFQSYRTLASLREYVLVSQDKQQIEHYIRQDDGQWLLSDTTDIDAIVTLPSINCTLKLADVYENINFEAE